MINQTTDLVHTSQMFHGLLQIFAISFGQIWNKSLWCASPGHESFFPAYQSISHFFFSIRVCLQAWTSSAFQHLRCLIQLHRHHLRMPLVKNHWESTLGTLSRCLCCSYTLPYATAEYNWSRNTGTDLMFSLINLTSFWGKWW